MIGAGTAFGLATRMSRSKNGPVAPSARKYVKVATLTVIESVPLLPFVSWAVTVITLAPAWSGMSAAVQLVVPTAAPLPPRSLAQVTDVTPVSSAAVPASVMNGAVDVVAGSAVGDVIVTVGHCRHAIEDVDVLDFRVGDTRGGADEDRVREHRHHLGLGVEVDRVDLRPAHHVHRRRRGRVDDVGAGAGIDGDGDEAGQVGVDRERVVAAETVDEQVFGRADVHHDVAEVAREGDARRRSARRP